MTNLIVFLAFMTLATEETDNTMHAKKSSLTTRTIWVMKKAWQIELDGQTQTKTTGGGKKRAQTEVLT